MMATKTMMISTGTILMHAVVITLVVILTTSGAFNSNMPRFLNDLSHIIRQHDPDDDHHQKDMTNNKETKRAREQHRRPNNRNTHFSLSKLSASSSSWLQEALTSLGFNFEQETKKFADDQTMMMMEQQRKRSDYDEDTGTTKKNNTAGLVIRTAVKGYHPATSKPTSPNYTTKKQDRPFITISQYGVEEDYNHYRAIALDNTPDRAVSILTTDVLQRLQTNGYSAVREGDLGENIYVDRVTLHFFEIGKHYKFGKSNNHNNNDDDEAVVIEITERIEPCGNLCRLPFISGSDNKNNNDNINDKRQTSSSSSSSSSLLEPKQRLELCKNFLLYLNQEDGLRGWYGKIIGTGGRINVGDRVTLSSNSNNVVAAITAS